MNCFSCCLVTYIQSKVLSRVSTFSR